MQLFVNQGYRDATILATLDHLDLMEYEMPNGTTALQIVQHGADFGRSVSYRALPKRWQRALIEQGATWIGNPQQNGRRGPLPQPAELFAEPVKTDS